MSLVGSFVTPHPPVMVPEVGRERLAEVQSTVDAMRLLAGEAETLAPEVIVLMSPHAPLDMSRMGVGAASWFEGSFGIFGAPEVRTRLNGAPDLARAVFQECLARRIPAHLLHEDRRAELDHGSMAPLVLLVERLAPLPSLVVLSFSYLEAGAHVEFGRAVGAVLDADSRRILYVASGISAIDSFPVPRPDITRGAPSSTPPWSRRSRRGTSRACCRSRMTSYMKPGSADCVRCSR